MNQTQLTQLETFLADPRTPELIDVYQDYTNVFVFAVYQGNEQDYTYIAMEKGQSLEALCRTIADIVYKRGFPLYSVDHVRVSK